MKHISYITNFEEWEKEFSFYEKIKVRFSETDMYGHVNNTVPFVYLESARIEFMKHLGLYKWARKDHPSFPVVADLQCDFINQMFFGEEIRVYVKVEKVGNSSVDFHYLGKKEDGTVCFTGRGNLVNVSKETGKGMPWSEEDRKVLLSSKNVEN